MNAGEIYLDPFAHEVEVAAHRAGRSVICHLVETLGAQRVHDSLTPYQRQAIRYAWRLWARPTVRLGEREYRGQIIPRTGWRNCLFLAGRGAGKALGLETPIPTPSGWTTMGAISVGDEVFDERGDVCTVTAVFDVDPSEAFRLTFSDGTQIDACGDHQWVTWTSAERKAFCRSPYEDTSRYPAAWPTWRLKRSCGGAEPKTYPDSPGPRVRTTTEIARTVEDGRGKNHAIPTCGPLRLPSKALPVDPYVLGAWLGDGASANNEITIGDRDAKQMISILSKCGCRIGMRRPHKDAAAAQYLIDGTERGSLFPRSLRTTLREIGVLFDKHVPAEYLRASPEQRLALLQGLMDTDGCASARSGAVEFTSTEKRLAASVVEIARSLGQKPVFSEGRATLRGRDVGPKYRVTWRATLPVFRLPRKLRRISKPTAQGLRNHARVIVSAESIPVRPMRCITVDSPNSLFLAGEGMIPTHNSRTSTEWAREKAENNPRSRGALIGTTAAEVRKVLGFGASGIANVCPPWNRPEWSVVDQCFVWPNGSLAFMFSGDAPDSLRGHEFDWGVFDEAAAARYAEEVWSNFQLALRRGPHPQAMVATTPRPLAFLRKLMEREDTLILRGSTFDNRANLPASFLESIAAQFGKTSLGRQEIEGALLEEAEGAIWRRAWIDKHRVFQTPPLVKIAIGVDPSASTLDEHDACGIVAVGIAENGHLYVLEDATLVASPEGWAKETVRCHHDNGAALVVVESTRGGAMVQTVIRLVPGGRAIMIRNRGAGTSKRTRAEPIAALYEAGMVHHVGDPATFEALETEMTGWIPPALENGPKKGKSPNRLDALVYAASELAIRPPPPKQEGLNVKGQSPRRKVGPF